MLRKYSVWYGKHTLVSIEGNIGSGKSTLLRLMKEKYKGLEFIGEPVQEWQEIKGEKDLNLLKQFYECPERWAYTMQVYAFYSRLKYWKEVLREQERGDRTFLSERSIESDKEIFAINGFESGLISRLEFALYEQFYEWLVREVFGESIDKQLIIYLKCDAAVCYERLQKRGRTEEKEAIGMDYLEQLTRRHEHWLGSPKQDRLVMVLEGNQEFEKDEQRQHQMFSQIDYFLRLHNII